MEGISLMVAIPGSSDDCEETAGRGTFGRAPSISALLGMTGEFWLGNRIPSFEGITWGEAKGPEGA